MKMVLTATTEEKVSELEDLSIETPTNRKSKRTMTECNKN
jgi:hypothetical protein